MIATQAVRLVSASPSRTRSRPARPSHAQRVRATAHARPARSLQAHARKAVRTASWDLRIFGAAIAAIVFCFAIALVYVSQTTALSVAGYDVQKLAAQRDELRRQNSLLEIQDTRLESPARIAADAKRLGMVLSRYVPMVGAQPLIAKR